MKAEPPGEASGSQHLSAQLKELGERASRVPSGMTVLELEEALRGRGIVVMVLLMSIPFALPVTIPGLSTPFGFAIFMIGLRLSLGQRPWIPQFVQRHRIPQERLRKLLRVAERAALKFERVARPRLPQFWRWGGTDRLLWLLVAVSAAMLCLPLPIPFSNTFFGISIVLLALGIMERDGIAALGGAMSLLVGTGYLAALIFFGGLGIDELMHRG